MNYASILSHLYGSYRPPIIDLLNQSIYASDYNIEKEDFVVHTGFSFDLQNCSGLKN